ncbi:hypothetical protein CCAL9344_03310 [Campylobacter sp. RM9344]|uniref:Uncharacterized protein n=1 Tax=Campylobacter californiensis TaxID=1032243 RepID=A0AAW3ZWC4_9BACT|nr:MULTISPECIES: hypothetical protein [unclassified Campylobacter]MBE2985058.1 hypothetical protein [Campylobacter sp. RM6883]MBE2986607.1 hypothetical protein [Campylobacter sp. RM12919]MBE2987598.1 hypothetical protein [Campylobacter sp. RM12920]MBE2995617.1 hypothetical protein [Campylobacter sp. RM6913]MBE3022258.1 hypothetical protein [Campylobacter sp. 7477a]MBE3029221.1 hypothetical protein [Campylobacter sp. RM9344]
MSKSKALMLSTTRLPFDHFVSGALVGAMSATALELGNKNKKTPLGVAKRVLKFSLGGGVVAAVGISASNSIAKGNYMSAATKTALGIGALILIENLIKPESN